MKGIEKIDTIEETDIEPDTSYLEGDRLKEFESGEFYYIGIYAKARIVVDGTIQDIRSGGLWGIESDSDEDYINEIKSEEMNILIDILKSLGFGLKDIKKVL